MAPANGRSKTFNKVRTVIAEPSRITRRTNSQGGPGDQRQRGPARVPYLARVAHELRTPVNTMMTLSELLLERALGPLNDDQAKYLEVVRRNGDTVLRLISDLIDMSRLESGHLPLLPVSFDVRDAIFRVVDALGPEAERKRLEVLVAPSAPLPPVVADPERVGQVLTNLIGNAIKFTDAGRIAVTTELQDRTIAVHVTDSGIGIPSAAVPGLFREFFQASAGEARRRGGTGLGLAITKGLVTAMGGDIWVASTVGKGSQFSFTLPRERRESMARLRPGKRLSPAMG